MVGDQICALGETEATPRCWPQTTGRSEHGQRSNSSLTPECELQIALGRHIIGDWGDLGEDGWQQNDQALVDGAGLFSIRYSKAGVFNRNGRWKYLNDSERKAYAAANAERREFLLTLFYTGCRSA